jgi:micrococcal nuclease
MRTWALNMSKLANLARLFVLIVPLLACSINMTAVTSVPGGIVIATIPPTPAVVIVSPNLPPNLSAAQVLKVIDGDTIDVQLGNVTERIRFIGIDTPESGVCYFAEATNRLKSLVTGQQVLLEPDPSQDDRDVYGRLLRFVWLPNGTFVNFVMVREGYAFEYTYRNPYKYQATFQEAGVDAQSEGQGLWNVSTCNGQAGRRN